MKFNTYEELLAAFEEKADLIDETMFYFKTDTNEKERYIGYSKNYEEPYWAGYCDDPDGLEFKSAKELLEAKIWDCKSIKEIFDDIEFVSIGGISLDNIDEW